ncbi:MAG TPA: UbiA-like polyprenyltransferase [Acidobacteriota bacterium]|nr:UbiA-like polyprenyltransferase [Acidobacteriota bacterium]
MAINSNAVKALGRYGKLVRFSHSVFALPFALSGLALATLETPFRWEVLLWVAVAMVAARSAAMGFNRIVDRHYDARNPRTITRQLPSGGVTLPGAWVLVFFSSAIFFGAAWMLNPLCGWLSPFALAILLFYSVTKRFTWTSQFWLGLSLGISPIGAWMALTGAFDARILPMSAAVLLWVAGFDIFYSCLDFEFDRAEKLHSVPQRWGITGGIWIARVMHLLTAVLLIATHWLYPFGPGYLIGVIVVIAILTVEDLMVRPHDLSRVMTAFNLNGPVSIVYYFAVLVGIIWR